MKLGALALPAYRTFSLEEIEEATGNFDSSAFMGEGSHGQVRKISFKCNNGYIQPSTNAVVLFLSFLV